MPPTRLPAPSAPLAPSAPSGPIDVHPPPPSPAAESAVLSALLAAVPVLGSLGAVAFVVTSGSSMGATRYLLAGLLVTGSLAFVVVGLWRTRVGRAAALARLRRTYLAHLDGVRAAVRAAAEAQRAHLTWAHPDPSALPLLVAEGTRVWERSVADPDWLQIRFGRGGLPLTADLRAPDPDGSETLDLVAVAARRRLLAAYRVVDDLPLSVSLAAETSIAVSGDLELRRALARSLVLQATAFHSPDDLVVAVLAGAEAVPHWEWVKWLPHARSHRVADAAAGRRLVCSTGDELASLLPETPGQGHLLLVLDAAGPAPGHLLTTHHGLTMLSLGPPEELGSGQTQLHLQAGPHGSSPPLVVARRPRREPVTGVADQVGIHSAEAMARRLAPRYARTSGARDRLCATTELTRLLGLGDVRTLDPSAGWASRPPRQRLRVPIGVGADGAAVELDLKESAEQGMGPHGLVIGATGAGKSELLRTLVLGLALTHSPAELNVVLVDFKGGATFAGMSELPHVSAVITNLAAEVNLVERMQDALAGELTRRQELLRRNGNHASVRDYEAARTSGAQPDLHPLPTLLVVVDEFSELLAARPDLIELFGAIGRLGRSLGIHLLLASQRLEEGRLRGLDSHLSYRIGLRTFSAAESRSVIGVSDAYELPPVPGLGYLRADPTSLVRFKAAYVSGPAVRSADPARPEVLPLTTGVVVSRQSRTVEVVPPEARDRTVFDLAVEAMTGCGPAAHRIWLPPLDVPDTFDRLLPDLTVDPDLGLVSRSWRARGPLRFPLGTVDRPREQRRDVFELDLSGAAGHVAVVGGPRSGRSTALRGVVAGLALTHTPRELQVFVLDLGGGAVAGMRDLPHVSGVATRGERETLARIVTEVTEILQSRERFFARHGVDGVDDYRRRRAAGEFDDGWGDVVVVVDGWGSLRSDFEDEERSLQLLAQVSLTFGVHLVTSAGRWLDYRPGMRDLFGTRVELRLGDATDSEIDRPLARAVPAGRPGRGIVSSRHHVLTALPRIDGDVRSETLGDGVRGLIAAVRDAWLGPDAHQLRLLPDLLTLQEIRQEAGATCTQLLLGVDERTLAPTGLDEERDPHLLVFGDGGSGKSALLRTVMAEVTRRHTPEDAQLFVVDYRRANLGEVDTAWLADYATTTDAARTMAGGLAQALRERLPGPDVTASQLRSRSWWRGAHAYLVVDDLELVASGQGHPLEPLVPLLAHARDVGLHVVAARRSLGAGRAYDPLLTALRDLASPGVLLSGDPSEGPLAGQVRAVPAVPGRGRLVTRDGCRVIQTAWTLSLHDD